MRKPIVRGAGILIALAALTGCSSAPVRPVEAEPVGASRSWALKFKGLITDLSVARGVGDLLVTVVPDPDRDGATENRTILLSVDGKPLWSRPNSARIKSQAVTPDASRVALADYEEKVSILDSQGKDLWQIAANCRPILLPSRRSVVCYHDDSVAPGLAFEVYDWEGRKTGERKASKDVLSMKASRDERWLVLSSVGGEVTLLGDRFEAAWSRKVPGEIIDLAVSGVGQGARVAVLSSSAAEGRVLQLWSQEGVALAKARIEPGLPAQAIEFSPDGLRLLVHGGITTGQQLLAYGAGLEPLWKRAETGAGDPLSTFAVGSQSVALGRDEAGLAGRRAILHGYSLESGSPRWSFEAQTEEGAYLTAILPFQGSEWLALASDDGQLSLWSIR